jgi:hypothetical protein
VTEIACHARRAFLRQIAGLPPNPEHDGKSLLPMLQSKQGSQARLELEAGWKTSQLIAYLSVGSYYNDHAKLWISGPAAQPGTPVVYAAGPFAPSPEQSKSSCIQDSVSATLPGTGKCYFVDSKLSNNWVAIRVRNATHNFVYRLRDMMITIRALDWCEN